MADTALESRVLLAAAFSFDFTTIASNLSTNPAQRFFGSPDASDSPFTIIRYGFGDITSITGLPATSGALAAPGDLSFSFGSDNAAKPVEVVTLSSFDNGLGDGLANQIYTPDANDVPAFTLFNAGVAVAKGNLLRISLQTTPESVVSSPSSAPSRFQLTAAVGADTTIFDELMAATEGTGIIDFSLSAFNLTGPWAGVGDAEIFSSTGNSLNLNDPPLPTDDHGNDIATATAWNRSAPITGVHEEVLSDDVDFFAVQLTAGTQYTFRVHDQDELPEDTVRMLLLDGTETDLVDSDPVPGTSFWTNSMTITAPATATYYIEVFNDGIRGGYSLEQTSAIVINGDDHGNGTTAGDATSWNRAAPIAGNIETPSDKDWFAVTLTAGVEYVFRTHPGTLYDSILELYAANRTTQLKINDDAAEAAGDEGYSKLSFISDATGTYYLVVSGYGYGDPEASSPHRMGSYSLSQVSSIPYMPARPVLAIVNNPLVTTNQRPKITWAAVDHATRYDVFLANIATPNTPALRQSVAGTSFTPAHDIGIGRWVVSIRAYSAQNVGSIWSAPLNLRINTPVTIGAVPFLAQSARPAFTWQPLPGAVSYELWIDNLSTGKVQVIPNPTPSTNNFTPASDLSAGVYRFWVLGISVDGSRGGWSAPAEMYVGPTTVAPVNPTFNVRPTFTWTAIPGISSHDIWIQKGWGPGATIIKNSTPIVGTTWTPAADLASGDYTWWVRGTLTNGQKITWSSPQSFNVGGQPILTQPSVIGTSTVISWTPVTGADHYELFVRRYMAGVVDLQTNQLTNSAAVSTTAPGTYQLWVRAVTSSGAKSLWSKPIFFVVSKATFIPENQPDSPETLLTVLPTTRELLADRSNQRSGADEPQPNTADVSDRVELADQQEQRDPEYSGPVQGVSEARHSMPDVTESAAFANVADIVMSEWDELQFSDRKQLI